MDNAKGCCAVGGARTEGLLSRGDRADAMWCGERRWGGVEEEEKGSGKREKVMRVGSGFMEEMRRREIGDERGELAG